MLCNWPLDDAIWRRRITWSSWWRHQLETFSALLAFVRGIHRSPVNSPHKDQWRGSLMFSVICAWINGGVNSREAGDLRRHDTHYDVIVMILVQVIACRNLNQLMWAFHQRGSLLFSWWQFHRKRLRYQLLIFQNFYLYIYSCTLEDVLILHLSPLSELVCWFNEIKIWMLLCLVLCTCTNGTSAFFVRIYRQLIIICLNIN